MVGDEVVSEGIKDREIVRSLDKVSNKKESKFRENPWIVSTIVLAVVLILVVSFGGGGYQGDSVGGNVVSGEVAASKLISFIESQSQGVQGDLGVVSSEKDGELYKVTLDFQGQEVPVFVSLDGQYLIADVIPLDPNLLPPVAGNVNNGAPSGGVVEVGDSYYKGREDADVTIVEFSDYQCPFCEKFWSETLSLIDENYIKTGKVKFVYLDFPLNIHPEAQKAAEAAKCVGAQLGGEGYFEMHDLLFGRQGELSIDNYKKWAREINSIDGVEFDNCLDSGEVAGDVLNEFAYGQSLGVTGTPGFIINGKLVSGAQPYSVFEQLIEAELLG